MTEAVRRRPHSVILFDEIEKAHREIFNVLLQILDDGRLTDAQGRTVDFRNAVVIMTSNIGSQFILERAGSVEWDEIERRVREELHQHFRPEFLNRIDDVILYKPLDEGHLRKIVDLQVRRVERLARARGVVLEVTDEARDVLAREGFDPAFGARPLKRTIQRLVQNPLALHLLEEEVDRGTRIRVVPGAGGSELAFEVADGVGEAVPEGDPRAEEEGAAAAVSDRLTG